MPENITFKDCKINSVIFENNSPINVSNNGSEINSLNISSLGNNSTKNFISLIGDFSETDIVLTSDCTINCEQGFVSNKPIVISSQTPVSIVLSGDFSNCDSLAITGPCSITTVSDTIFKPNFNVLLSVKQDLESKNVSINGDFSECNINVDASCNLNLSGSIQTLNIKDKIENQTLSLEVDTKISSANISSSLSVSGNEDSITNLKNNTLIGGNNITISSISKIVLMDVNGTGTTNLNIESSGKYKIIASISLPTENMQIGEPLLIDI